MKYFSILATVAIFSTSTAAACPWAGLVPDRVLKAIENIQQNLPTQSYAFNLIHSPNEEALEAGAVKLFLEKGVHVVEASAFLGLTDHIVKYRVAGLSQDAEGNIQIKNKVIAKISRKEIATHFMQPAPESFLEKLLQSGEITAIQAELARKIPMADDITIEAMGTSAADIVRNVEAAQSDK